MAAIHELGDEQSYEAQVRQCVGVTGFHHWFFLSAVAEAFNAKFRAYAVESDGQPLGIVPLLFRRRGPVSTVNYFPSLSYIGPLLRREAFRTGRMSELVGAVEPILRKYRTVKTVWSFSPGLNMNTDQLTMPGFDAVEKDSYTIPATRLVDDCWTSMSQLRRRSIRHCISNGISAADSSAAEITRWLPEQISKGYAKQGALAAYKPSEARSLTERLAPHPRMLWRSVRAADGEVLAVSGNIISDERLENWLMVGPHLAKISAHSLAYWDLINWALPKGLTLDFGGAPSEGVGKFKISASCEHKTGLSAVQVRYKVAYEASRALYNWVDNRRRGKRLALDGREVD